jgi:hypothetical protein
MWRVHLEENTPNPWQEWQLAQLCALVANKFSETKFKARDFIPRFYRATKKTVEEIRDGLKAWCLSTGGRLGRPKRDKRV